MAYDSNRSPVYDFMFIRSCSASRAATELGGARRGAVPVPRGRARGHGPRNAEKCNQAACCTQLVEYPKIEFLYTQYV